ncbi:MAG: hypothetical protein JWR59_2249 [Brevundimonas sp.]|nr:hypothetical protein [Brevundimonas sp.]
MLRHLIWRYAWIQPRRAATARSTVTTIKAAMRSRSVRSRPPSIRALHPRTEGGPVAAGGLEDRAACRGPGAADAQDCPTLANPTI